MLADFDPPGAPQLAQRTFSLPPGGCRFPSIRRPAVDLGRRIPNLEVSLSLDPVTPIAGKKTMLFLDVKPADGLEPYLGAWAHLLAVSHDLVDTIHTHPFLADGGPRMQFNLFLPRVAIYRIWIQMQRSGVVNTVAFTVKSGEAGIGQRSLRRRLFGLGRFAGFAAGGRGSGREHLPVGEGSSTGAGVLTASSVRTIRYIRITGKHESQQARNANHEGQQPQRMNGLEAPRTSRGFRRNRLQTARAAVRFQVLKHRLEGVCHILRPI